MYFTLLTCPVHSNASRNVEKVGWVQFFKPVRLSSLYTVSSCDIHVVAAQGASWGLACPKYLKPNFHLAKTFVIIIYNHQYGKSPEIFFKVHVLHHVTIEVEKIFITYLLEIEARCI